MLFLQIINNINEKTFFAINNLAGHNSMIDKLIMIIADYLPLILVLTIIILWFRKKKTSGKSIEKNHYKQISLLSLYSAIIGLLLNKIISTLYYHPRPFVNNKVLLLIKHSADSSFPSDHTTLMLSIALMLIYFTTTRRTGIILTITALIGGIARIYVGVHYPLDIIGSIITSTIASTIIFYERKKLFLLNNKIIDYYEHCYDLLRTNIKKFF